MTEGLKMDYGWTIQRYCPHPGGSNYDQSALPYEVIKAFPWTPENKRCATKEEAEKWADRASLSAAKYWKARMS